MALKNIQVVGIKQVRLRSLPFPVHKVRCPLDAYTVAEYFLGGADREHFIVMCLDNKQQINAVNTVSMGDINSCPVSPREVFKPAFLSNSGGIILVHNHPSGDPTPSKEDIAVTKRLVDAGQLLSIQIYDHIVLGEKRYVSLKEKGVI